MSYTPGTWRVGMRNGANANCIFAENGETAFDDDTIAQVYGIPIHCCLEDVPANYAEGMANARLISAAPDMAEALRDLLEDYQFAASEWDRDARAQADLLIEQARAALAKAGL